MVYKAHQHEITDCAVTIGSGDETPIDVVPLN